MAGAPHDVPIRDVLIRDVTLRDGLQDEAPISTEAKLALYDALVAARLPELELTSFVRPDRVPAMADAEAHGPGHRRGWTAKPAGRCDGASC